MTSMAAGRLIRRWFGGRGSPGGRETATNHVAFGTFCHIAAALRACGLRRWTGPLDWVFSTPSMVAACLDDDFAGLIDPRNLESVPPERLTGGADRQCRHRLYEERYGLPTLFNHHDPVRFPADRAALERAVARMRRALAGPARNAFYMMSERDWPREEIDELVDRLDRRPAASTLVVLALDGRGHAHGLSRSAERRPGLVEVTVRTGAGSRGVRFADPADEAHLARVLAALAAEIEGREEARHRARGIPGA